MNITLDGIVYATSRKLDVFTQLHVARKLGSSIPVLEDLFTKAEAEKTIFSILMFSKMEDAETEYVMKKCLAVVSRQQPTGFVPVQNQQGGLMFDDIGLDALLRLTLMVIEENLGTFFTTALSALVV